MHRGVAAACYVPIPGLAWLLTRSAPKDRLVRHHARQGGWLAAATWALLLAIGLLMGVPALIPALTPAAGAVVGLALAGITVGVVSAARGRFVRIRPIWDVAVAFSGSTSRRSRSA